MKRFTGLLLKYGDACEAVALAKDRETSYDDPRVIAAMEVRRRVSDAIIRCVGRMLAE